MNSKWFAMLPEAPVTATLTVFFQEAVRLGDSCGGQQPVCRDTDKHIIRTRCVARRAAAAPTQRLPVGSHC